MADWTPDSNKPNTQRNVRDMEKDAATSINLQHVYNIRYDAHYIIITYVCGRAAVRSEPNRQLLAFHIASAQNFTGTHKAHQVNAKKNDDSNNISLLSTLYQQFLQHSTYSCSSIDEQTQFNVRECQNTITKKAPLIPCTKTKYACSFSFHRHFNIAPQRLSIEEWLILSRHLLIDSYCKLYQLLSYQRQYCDFYDSTKLPMTKGAIAFSKRQS